MARTRLTARRLRGRPAPDRRPSVARPLVVFGVAGLVAVVVLGLVATAVLRGTARQEAIRETKEITRLAGVGIAEPLVSDGLLAGDPRARARFDRIMRERVLRESVVRVKLWTLDGRIVYSDEPRLIGRRFRLGPDELAAARRGIVDTDVSDLRRPENRYERGSGKLLEAYLPIRAPDGTRLLFEDYLRFSAITESEHRQFSRFAPALIGTLVLLWLAQLPLAASLARRVRQRQAERETLLKAAIDASDLERQRIAQHLHDGVVQELAGVSFSLAATADRLDRDGEERASGPVREAAAGARRAIRELRSLMIGIYPARLRRSGLAAALSDLAAPLTARGVSVELSLPGDLDLPLELEEVLFSGAQEGLRNVAKHADAGHVDMSVGVVDGRARLTIADDGRGFDQTERSGRLNGHFGLRLLEDLAAARGGRLLVHSTVGEGTRVTVEVPVE